MSQELAPKGPAAAVEAALFSAINVLMEPAVRAGFGSLWVLPAGFVVLETRGRRSGKPHRVPVLAAEIGGYVVVSTVRVGSSKWLRNVIADPNVRFWMRGEPRDAQAIVIMPGEELQPGADDDVRRVMEIVRPQAETCGAAFVILTPAR